MGTHGEQLCGPDIGYSIGRSLHSLRPVGMTVDKKLLNLHPENSGCDGTGHIRILVVRSIDPDDFLRGILYFLRRTGQAGFPELYPFEKDHGVGIARAFHQLYGASVAAATLHGSGRSHTDESFLILHFRMAVQFRIDITP